jgi:hypothetical protein
MDGGSSINILYEDTLKRLKLQFSIIRPTTTVFYGIVPGRKASPIGWINLEVAFGTEANYRKEVVCFDHSHGRH